MPAGRTYKARTQAYDNITVNSAVSSQERTILGSLPPDTSTYGPTAASGLTENIAVGSDYSADENIVVAGTNELAGERLG